MADHGKYVALAKRLIAKHGRDVTLKVISATHRDPDQPWLGTNQPPTVLGPLKAAFVPFRGYEFGAMYEQDELFKNVNEVCLIAGEQAEIEFANTLTDEGKDYHIEGIRKLRPADRTIVYALAVNR